jgi:four helix bundle protein
VVKENPIREKSFDFALQIIELYVRMRDSREYVLSKQLLRCGTSIGANVEESSAAQSRSDFISKLSIASKEARETKYWLRLIQRSRLVEIDVTEELAKVEELIRLLTAIVKSTGENR